jgi:hypothetical protein
MGHFAKPGVFFALGLMLVPAAPALAGPHHRAVAFRWCHAGPVARREHAVHSAPSFAVVAVVTDYRPPAPWPDATPGPYPVGYDGSSATPTGYGVVYNAPSARNLDPHFPRESGGVVSAAY